MWFDSACLYSVNLAHSRRSPSPPTVDKAPRPSTLTCSSKLKACCWAQVPSAPVTLEPGVPRARHLQGKGPETLVRCLSRPRNEKQRATSAMSNALVSRKETRASVTTGLFRDQESQGGLTRTSPKDTAECKGVTYTHGNTRWQGSCIPLENAIC